MLKKILSLAIVTVMLLGMFTLTVSAVKVGDPLGDILNSDITAYINGNAIPTSIKSGMTMVVVEDLAKYGFDVVWNGADKTLKVEINANKKVTPIPVEKNINPVGTFKCKYVYTDIKTYLSGKQVESFAINGQTLINFELLAMYGKLKWDGAARTISLTTSGMKPSIGAETGNISEADANTLTENIFALPADGIYHIKTGIYAASSDNSSSEIIEDTYMKNGKIAMSMEMYGTTVRIVIDGGKMYMIMDQMQTVTVTDVSSASSEELFGFIPGLGQIGNTNMSGVSYSGSGTADFRGNMYNYVEFEVPDTGTMRYFFDDNKNPKGIQIIMDDGTSVDMEILALDSDVPDGVFDIPANYTVTEN